MDRQFHVPSFQQHNAADAFPAAGRYGIKRAAREQRNNRANILT